MDVGDVLASRYELLEQVGVGGMGRVVRAHDRVLGRTVAVKLLAPHLLGDTAAIEALRDEARRAASVRHANVVQVLDAVLDDTEQPAIVMEFVDGPTLAEVVPEGGLPIDEAVEVLAAIGAGLRAVHDAGLVHRDITPGNVLLDGGVPRLTDFGIARSAAATSTQTIQGSASYLAPEQARGAAVGPAADVYALGCLATTLLTGRPPFAADHAVGVVHQHLTSPPPDVRDRRPEIPAAIAAAVAGALAKDPGDRPADVAAMLAAFPTEAATPAVGGMTTRVIDAPPSTRVLDPPTTTVLPTPRGWPSSVAALVAVGVLVAAVVGVLATRPDDLPEVAATPDPVAASPTPSPTSPPSPSPSPSPTPLAPEDAVAAGLSDLRALLVDLRSSDDLSAEALEKLDERTAEVAKELDEGKANDVAKKLRELRRELAERVDKEDVSREAENEILARLLVIEDAAADLPRGEGRSDSDEDEDDD